jgi:hypothetical protein
VVSHIEKKHGLRVYENMVLRRIFRPTRDGITGEWRRLHDEELQCLYPSPNIIRTTKCRLRGAGHVARMVDSPGACRVLVRKHKTDHFEHLGIDGRIILKCIFRKYVGVNRIDLVQCRNRLQSLVKTGMNLLVT